MFIPHTHAERDEMLKTIGLNKIGRSVQRCSCSISISEAESSIRVNRNGSISRCAGTGKCERTQSAT